MTDYRLLSGVTPASTYSGAGEYYTLGIEFDVTATCWLTTVWHYRPSGGLAAAPFAVYSVDAGGATGTLVSGTSGTQPSSGTGWRSTLLSTPVKLAVGTYRAGVYHSNQTFAYTSSYWTTGGGSSGRTSGPLTAPNRANSEGTVQGPNRFTTTNSGLGFPGRDGLGQLYGVDVTVTDVDPTGQFRTMFLPYMQ
jgi:hypothetical protein